MTQLFQRKILPLAVVLFGLLALLDVPIASAQEEEVFQPEEEPIAQPDESFTPRRPNLQVFHIDSSDPDQAITVDGFFGEDPWSNAEVATGFTQQEPFDGQPASERTEVRVLISDTTLYVGVLAFDSEPEKIIAKEMSRDGSIRRDDGVIIILDTFHDGRNAYYFQTNPNGARTDSLVTDEGRNINREWDGVWGASSRITNVGWQTEIAIPLSTIRYDTNKSTWGFQVSRTIQRKREDVNWAPLPREAGNYRISLAGTLSGLDRLKTSRSLDIKPYAVGAITRDEGVPRDEDLEFGLDVKWGIAKGLSLDLTYNTDFAEVEVDEQRVNLTRFSLFFPEKREFFLENAGIFSFGGREDARGFDTPLLRVFFSRRIGLVEGEQVPIVGGTRLTGRVGQWSLGLLAVQTDDFESEDINIGTTGFGVARIKRNLGQRSSIGMIATYRDEDGGNNNRVFGLDADWNPTSKINLNAFAVQSYDDIAKLAEDDPNSGDDWAGGAAFGFDGREFKTSFEATQVGGDFNPEVGFLLRDNVRRYKTEFEYEPRVQKAGLRNLDFGIENEYVSDIDGTLATNKYEIGFFGLRTLKNDGFSLRLEQENERLFEDFEITDDIIIPEGRYDADPRLGFFAYTSDARPLSIRGGYSSGGFFNGDSESIFLRIGTRASKYFRTSPGYSYNHVELPEGSFSVNNLNQRFDVSLTPQTLINSVVQWNDLAETVGINMRFNWIYRPGADLFVVYNHSWNAPDLGDLSTRDRAIIVKFTYLFQF